MGVGGEEEEENASYLCQTYTFFFFGGGGGKAEEQKAKLTVSNKHILNLFFLKYFIIPCRKFGSPYSGKAQQLQEQCYPFLSMCAVFFACPNNGVGLFNIHSDADACECTWGLYGH